MKERSNDRDFGPSPLAEEGGERRQRRREPGEGTIDSPKPARSPALATLAHPLPQRERERKICVAKIGAAHGVRGDVRLWPFTEDPLAVLHYGPLSTRDGARQFEVLRARAAKDHLVATLKGIATREDAERINGTELYIARDALPATDANEYYHTDLIGLRAVDTAGGDIGKVLAIHNFGAGDIIEIAPVSGPTLLLPFTNAVVPTVDIAGGRVVIAMPGEIEGEDSPA